MWSNSSSNGRAIKSPSPHRSFLLLPRSHPSTTAPINAPPPEDPQRIPHLTSPSPVSSPPLPHQSVPPPSTPDHHRAALSPSHLTAAHPPVRLGMGSPTPSPPWLVPLSTRAVGGRAPVSSVLSVHGRPTVDQGSGGPQPRGPSLQGFPLWN
jgi:hypothetical protein